MRKILLTAASAAALVAFGSFAGPAAHAQQITLRLHSFLVPVANPPKTFIIPWINKINAAAKGKMKIQPFWAMALGGTPPQLLDQVRDGVVDIAWTVPGFTAGRMPRVEPFELPFVHKDALSSTLALQDFQDKYLNDTDLKDYHTILLHVQQGYMFQTKGPVRTVADLKKMKIRAASRAGVWMLDAIGATGVGLPLTDIPSALQKSVIDGVLLPYEIAPAVKMQDLANYFTTLSGEQPRLSTSVFSFLMNKKSYEGLPADMRKVIDDFTGRKIAQWAGQNWVDIEEPGRKVMASKKKNHFEVMSPAETAKLKKAVEPVFTRWFAEMKKVGVDGPALLADARKMIDKYSK